MNRTLKIVTAIVVGLIVLVGVGIGVFLLMPTVIGATSGSSQAATPTIAANTSTTPQTNTKSLAQSLKQYTPNIEQQLASGLKMTPDQLTTAIRSGKSLSQVASDQKVTGSQLDTVISNAIQNGLQPAVSSGTLMQKQVTTLVKRYQKNPDQLGRLIVPRQHKKTTAVTPTPQP